MSAGTPASLPYGPGPGRRGRVLLGPPETRGRTQIADRVLERIAALAVAEVEEAGPAAEHRVLGVPLGRGATGTAPRVSAHADGDLAIVRVTLPMTYPVPIREVTRRVRDNVTARVREMTDLDTRQVDIDVTRLVPPPEPEGRLL